MLDARSTKYKIHISCKAGQYQYSVRYTVFAELLDSSCISLSRVYRSLAFTWWVSHTLYEFRAPSRELYIYIYGWCSERDRERERRAAEADFEKGEWSTRECLIQRASTRYAKSASNYDGSSWFCVFKKYEITIPMGESNRAARGRERERETLPDELKNDAASLKKKCRYPIPPDCTLFSPSYFSSFSLFSPLTHPFVR